MDRSNVRIRNLIFRGFTFVGEEMSRFFLGVYQLITANRATQHNKG